MLAALAIASLLQLEPTAKLHQPDTVPLEDPMRPIRQITRDGFTIQYFTSKSCETRIQLRQDDLPLTAFGRTTPVKWQIVSGSGPPTTWHVLNVTGLRPGSRYYYRVYDPGLVP